MKQKVRKIILTWKTTWTPERIGKGKGKADQLQA
jgi:hypothetical protein